MLRVKTYLSPSKIGGIGLFAKEFIKAGTIVYKFDHGIEPCFKSLSGIPYEGREFMNKFCFSHLNEFRLPIDNDRFMNHDEPANCIDNGERCMALTDIEKGTEITCNYKDLGCTDQDRKFNLNQLPK